MPRLRIQDRYTVLTDNAPGAGQVLSIKRLAGPLNTAVTVRYQHSLAQAVQSIPHHRQHIRLIFFPGVRRP
nr:hypothetical protein orf29 [uncultured archaeon]